VVLMQTLPGELGCAHHRAETERHDANMSFQNATRSPSWVMRGSRALTT
jgi:hypothetical protein